MKTNFQYFPPFNFWVGLRKGGFAIETDNPSLFLDEHYVYHSFLLTSKNDLNFKNTDIKINQSFGLDPSFHLTSFSGLLFLSVFCQTAAQSCFFPLIFNT